MSHILLCRSSLARLNEPYILVLSPTSLDSSIRWSDLTNLHNATTSPTNAILLGFEEEFGDIQ